MTTRRTRARNPISLLGAAIAGACTLLFAALFVLDSLGYLTNPYLGLVTFIALPLGFVLGLFLVPAGVVWAGRRGRAGRPTWPTLDLNEPAAQRIAAVGLLVGLGTLVVLSTATYGAVHYMSSVEFCGVVCHDVMEPEFTAYQTSPHAHVPCVDCHVGPGAANFAEAKLAGVRQLAIAMTGSYARPIPAPARTLRPARETCEQCHWPEKFHGDRFREVREYANDEESTETITTLRVHVGGGSERLGVATGIHWHMNVGNEVEYIALDYERQQIPYVMLREQDGSIREFTVDGATAEQLAGGTRHRMDCMDCHNRPSHILSTTPERAVDGALAIGRVDRSLPFIRRELVAALSTPHDDRDVATDSIRAKLEAFYGTSYPAVAVEQRGALAQAVQVGQELYRQNVFPSMRIDWGTYTNEIGHADSPGCFRCHDDEHRAADGSVIRQDCEICHSFE
jgi:hypothetical protein